MSAQQNPARNPNSSASSNFPWSFESDEVLILSVIDLRLHEAVQKSGLSFLRLGYLSIDDLYNATNRDVLKRLAMICIVQAGASCDLEAKYDRLCLLQDQIGDTKYTTLSEKTAKSLLNFHWEQTQNNNRAAIVREGEELVARQECVIISIIPELERLSQQESVNAVVLDDKNATLRNKIKRQFAGYPFIWNVRNFLIEEQGHDLPEVLDFLAAVTAFYYSECALTKGNAGKLRRVLCEMGQSYDLAKPVPGKKEAMWELRFDGTGMPIARKTGTSRPKKVRPFDSLTIPEKNAVMDRAFRRGQFGSIKYE